MKNTTYINAGAGSGKTYTLTNLLAEKLSNGEVEPSQVILTTFTELAAAEFREKARVQILDKGKLDAAAQMDSAAMGTVHSVALHFIQKFWYLLDYGADIQPISERDEDYYMNQSLARIMNETEANGILKAQADLDNFKRFRNYFDICDSSGNPDYLFWQRYLRDIVEKMEYYNVTNLQTSIDKSMETLKAVFNKKTDSNIKDQLLADLNAYYQFIRVINKKIAIEQAQIIAPLLKNCNDAKDLLPLASALKKPVGGPTTINSNCPEYASFMSKLSELPASKDNIQILEPFVKSIFKLAQVWRNDYINYKKKNRLISYNDMEQLFLQLLTNEKEVQDYVSSHYRLVMVDEFQDSNPIQLKIFNRLSELVAQGGGHSYWVGDPKQAIYGFRGSDTELVNSVAQHFKKFYNDSAIHPEEGPNMLGTGRLTESWRSRQQLVELVNETFYEPFKKDGINDLLIKLDAHHKIDNVTYPAIAHFESSASNLEGAALDLAAQVKQLLQSKMLVHKGQLDCAPSEISPRDIAVLCKTNEDAKKIVKALRGLHVPVSEPEDAILQRIEVQLVVTLLHFLQNPSDKHVRADLMRLLWGKTTEEILKDRIAYVEQNNPTDQWQDDAVSELLKQSERYKHLSIPEMVKGLIYECNIPALTARWGDAHIRQQNLSTLQHLADDYDEMCLQMGQGSSISGFINYLNSNEPDKEKDNMSDTVKVFTYHGAKGLEWPVVIMHGLQKDVLEQQNFTRKNFMRVREMVLNDNTTATDPFNKVYYIHVFPYILKTPGNGSIPAAVLDNIAAQPIYDQLRSKAASEERRLLYVGMTRAKDQLITFGYKGQYYWLINAGVVNPTVENVWGKEEFKPYKLEPKALSAEDHANASDEYSIKEKPQEHTVHEKRYLSPSKIETFDGYTTHRAWAEKGAEISSKGWGKDYATIGSCIHNIFAVYRPGQDEANKKAALRVIGGYGLAGQLDGHVDAILRSADWLYDQLQQHFPQREGDGTEREYPFQATLPTGQTLRGEMDLLWHYSDEHGQHCVLVDYKSFQGVDLHSYSRGKYPQLSAYASSLKDAGIDVAHALVYYPVHGVIHELR
ncbi:MAG: UvrD-helicase domain-containing protein [Bacteroidales bacterium]|nr:UvrD-helicase domain-containing protein [Bacteroidales bacterium]